MFGNIFNGPGSIRSFIADGLGMLMCGGICYFGGISVWAMMG